MVRAGSIWALAGPLTGRKGRKTRCPQVLAALYSNPRVLVMAFWRAGGKMPTGERAEKYRNCS